MGSFKYDNKISVVFSNGVTDQISPALLDSLIRLRRINQFERDDGWAEIGIDPVRGMGGREYDGFNRRLN